MAEPASYKYDLGKGLSVSAFSLTPEIDSKGLATIVSSMDGKANQDLRALSQSISYTDYLDSIKNIELAPQPGAYTVPEPLKKFREAVQKDWDSEGRFNGPVIIATAEIEFPLKVVQGGYYDYAATRLDAVPASLVPETYAPGKTVESILAENNLPPEARARYFGFAHLMWPSKGDELLLVQRARGMGIAADCVCTPGSTPDIVLGKPGLLKSGFGVEEYWSHHFAEEMKDEFHLGWGDFWVQDTLVFDDKKLIPFGAVNIYTELSAKNIAAKAYGDPRVLKEHTILYSIPGDAIRTFLEKFPVFPSAARAMDVISKSKKQCATTS